MSTRRARRIRIGRSQRPRLGVAPTAGASAGRGPRSDEPVSIDGIVVVVPARDEADHVDACLTSVAVAAARCDQPVVVVLAADCCADETAAVARRRARSFQSPTLSWGVLEGAWASPSRARSAAVRSGLELLGVDEPRSVWIAHTDADCTVTDDWLIRQVAHAHTGADALAGSVRLDPAATSPVLLARFDAHYGPAESDHDHVHAANVGIRADVYLQLGGWSARTVLGEEHVLWRRLRERGFEVLHPGDIAVTTSSRTVGRVPGGFAARLARLAGGAPPVEVGDDQDVCGRSNFRSLATTAS